MWIFLIMNSWRKQLFRWLPFDSLLNNWWIVFRFVVFVLRRVLLLNKEFLLTIQNFVLGRPDNLRKFIINIHIYFVRHCHKILNLWHLFMQACIFGLLVCKYGGTWHILVYALKMVNELLIYVSDVRICELSVGLVLPSIISNVLLIWKGLQMSRFFFCLTSFVILDKFLIHIALFQKTFWILKRLLLRRAFVNFVMI